MGSKEYWKLGMVGQKTQNAAKPIIPFFHYAVFPLLSGRKYSNLNKKDKP
jgi:hypothetical protein